MTERHIQPATKLDTYTHRELSFTQADIAASNIGRRTDDAQAHFGAGHMWLEGGAGLCGHGGYGGRVDVGLASGGTGPESSDVRCFFVNYKQVRD